MGRTPCCSKMGLNRGPWTPEEDQLLSNYIKEHGEGGWRTLPKKAGLLRCGKSCRLRWMNYLRPDVKRGQILPDEEDLILRLHRLLGNRWSLIAGRIPGRTDNEIKNYWNTHLSRKLISQGIDPRTHKPLAESELDNHAPHDTNNKEDSGNKPSPASVFQEKCSENGIVADNIEAYKLVEDHHSPQLIKDSEIPETSVTGSLHAYNDSNTSNTVQPPAFQDAACKQPSSSAVNIIPYCNVPSDLGLQDHDASVYLRRNSITNSYFMAPQTMDSGLQKIPSFLGSVTENGPYQGFPMNIEQSAIQQRQVTEESRMDVIPMTAGTTVEDYNSDIFSYFLESFMGEDHLHDEANKHGASSVSENWQQFSQTESSSRLGYNMQSMMLTPSQDPSKKFQRL